ncbi:hypothetical protein AVEN_49575-1 [Araneus ventricosus]|uniref:Uncharacterized protein n=1 Tax=Araneus ventricosus TaxID=182803 RepID=A0A4Y2U5C0_ARAVE|nr:hypothetical protein AVEN_166154-1 [Araneus ventricosus]GBO08175.1 hypothetical protein AVEN_49575-1 [Araneus ventricosus]
MNKFLFKLSITFQRDIFSMVKIQDEYTSEESAEEEDSTGLVTHANSADGLEVALRYVEQHCLYTDRRDVCAAEAQAASSHQGGLVTCIEKR